jgi:hypothetical protein
MRREGMMRKQPVQVIIGREVQRTAPGMLGRKFDFKPGHTFLTQEWFYPGEPDENGELTGKTHDQWGFRTNTGTDLPLTFDSQDIGEVVISNDPETVKVFKRAPFKVIIRDQQS